MNNKPPILLPIFPTQTYHPKAIYESLQHATKKGAEAPSLVFQRRLFNRICA